MFLLRLVKWFIAFCLNQFFYRITVSGAKPVEDGPLIVIGNHPYSVLDPLVISSVYDRDFAFVTKATMFDGWLKGWIMRQLNMIPINRVQDGGSQRDNLKTLEETAKLVASGKPLIIFAEGMSNGLRELAKLKNGPARIAMMAEELLGWSGELKIQVVGVTYSDFNDPFKSTVTVHLEEPITVTEWKAQYEKHVGLAARDLTRKIEQDMRDSTVEVKGPDTPLVEMIGDFYAPVHPNDKRRLETISQAVSTLAPQFPEKRAEIERDLSEYLAINKSLRLHPRSETRVNWWSLLLAIPVYFGFATHYAPYKMADLIATKRRQALAGWGYEKFSRGVKVFLGWYAIVAVLLAGCAAFGLIGWMAAIGIFALHATCGVMASQWLRQVNAAVYALLQPRSYRRMCELGKKLEGDLEEMRSRL